MTLSDAKKRANKKWNDKNKERMTYRPILDGVLTLKISFKK